MISTLSKGNEQRFGHVSQRRGTEVHCIGTRVRKEGAKEEEEEEGAGEAHSCTAHSSRFPTLTASEGVSE